MFKIEVLSIEEQGDGRLLMTVELDMEALITLAKVGFMSALISAAAEVAEATPFFEEDEDDGKGE